MSFWTIVLATISITGLALSASLVTDLITGTGFKTAGTAVFAAVFIFGITAMFCYATWVSFSGKM